MLTQQPRTRKADFQSRLLCVCYCFVNAKRAVFQLRAFCCYNCINAAAIKQRKCSWLVSQSFSPQAKLERQKRADFRFESELKAGANCSEWRHARATCKRQNQANFGSNFCSVTQFALPRNFPPFVDLFASCFVDWRNCFALLESLIRA